VGGKEPLRADVRIIAATHRDLEAMVAAGAFRMDLLFRLNVFPIVLPPLRERSEDIPIIAAALLQRLAARFSRPVAPALDAASLAALAAHPWPGNVRELENVLERAMILSPGSTLTIGDLPEAPALAGAVRKKSETLASATRRHIEATLRACGGRIYGADGAAVRLGVPPTTLQSKMLRLGVARRRHASETS
jgi:DNA-binding NtrC family response regulator